MNKSGSEKERERPRPGEGVGRMITGGPEYGTVRTEAERGWRVPMSGQTGSCPLLSWRCSLAFLLKSIFAVDAAIATL